MSANQNNIRNSVRIPNLPMGRIVDENGAATGEELTFRQALLTLLQQLIGDEGLVMPSQTTSNITTIVAGTSEAPGAIPDFTYTCAPGTLFYNSTSNTIQVTVLSGSTPVIKTITIF